MPAPAARFKIPACFVLALAVIAVLAAALAAAPALAKVLLPRHAAPPDRYLEIVRQKSPCPDGDCFIEYIFLSDGTAVRKTFSSDNYEADAKIDNRKADADATALLLGAFDDFFAGAKPAKWTSNGGQIYFYNGGPPQTYSTADAAAPAFAALFGQAQAVFDAAPAAEDFYLHDYYQIFGGEIEDYHVFADGRVIFSTFSRQSDKMLATAMMHYAAADFQRLQALSKDAFAAPASPYRKCAPETGIEYGLVEIQNRGRYIKSHTCADGNDGIAILFRYLRGAPGLPK